MSRTRPVTPGCEGLRRTATGVVPAMLVPCVASLVYFVLLPGGAWSRVVYAGTKTFTVVWPVIAVCLIEGTRLRWKAVGWRRNLAALPLGVATGLLIGGMIAVAYLWTPAGDYAHRFSGRISAKVIGLGIGGAGGFAAFSIFISVVHSLIEEYYWRWYVFGRLARLVPAGQAYALASLSFAAHHYVLLWCYFPPLAAILMGTAVGLGGALWCWMYRRQGVLSGAWISHALVDAAICCVGYRLVFA